MNGTTLFEKEAPAKAGAVSIMNTETTPRRRPIINKRPKAGSRAKVGRTAEHDAHQRSSKLPMMLLHDMSNGN